MVSERQLVPFADVVEIISGGTPKTSIAEYWGGDIPWLSVSDFNTGYRWVSSSEKSITDFGLSNSATNILDAGDIIISARGTVGVIAQLAKPMAFNQSCYGIRGKKGVSDTNFIYYALKNAVSQMLQVAYGGVFNTITRDTFKIISTRLPFLKKQEAIACILGALDDKIELNRQMCKTMEDTAQAIFKSWFVDFDPVHAKATGKQPQGMNPEIAALFPDSFEDTDLGTIPKGWRLGGLDSLGEFLNGLALQKYPPTEDEWLPAIKIAQLRTNDTRNADKVSSSISEEYIVKDGDILFSWSGSLECVVWTGGKGALNQHLFRVTSDEYPKWFIYFWIHYHLPEFRHIAAGKATTMGHIQRHHLRDAKVVIPLPDILDRAHRTINPLLESMVIRYLENKQLEFLRDLLLPQLVSGKLQVSDAETIIKRCS